MAGIESVEVYRDAHLMRTLHCQRSGKSAYDINPSVDRKELCLAVDETDSTCDVSIAMSAHRSCVAYPPLKQTQPYNPWSLPWENGERKPRDLASPGQTEPYGCRVRSKSQVEFVSIISA